MPSPVFSEYRASTHHKRNFGALYVALILLSLHWAVVLYINSSFLEQFLSGKIIGLLYTVGSLITVACFLLTSRLLRRTGNYAFTITLTILEFLALVGMSTTETPLLAALFFVMHSAAAPLILFSLDIFMEELIGNTEGSTGGKRGLFLTIMSLTGALAALFSGFLVGDSIPDFSAAYIASALLLIPFLFIIMRYFKSFEDPEYSRLNVLSGISCFFGLKDVRNVFFAHFLLQIFFTWMVIYTPLYLSKVLGFNWEQIGQIMFGGLMAYVFLEYAIGYIADKWIGEKEMMALGFVIMAVSTSWFTFLTEPLVIVWMLAMFMTRVGASFVETTTESYFFKHTDGHDSVLISFFRLTRPLSIVIGSLLGSLTLYFLPMQLIFIVLGFLMIPGLFFTMALKDTK